MIILLKSDADAKTVSDLKEWLSRWDVSIESADAFGSEVIKVEGDLDKIDFSLKQNKEGIFVKTNNYVFSNMLDGKKNEDILLDEVRFNFSGTENDEIGTSLSRLIKIKNNEITKDTFSKIKSGNCCRFSKA